MTYLIGRQQGNGCVGNGDGYCHSIVSLGLAEAFGMAGMKRTRAAAQKAVDYSIKEHQKPGSAWRYGAKQDPDTSVTGWFVMQLKSGIVARLEDGTEVLFEIVGFWTPEYLAQKREVLRKFRKHRILLAVPERSLRGDVDLARGVVVYKNALKLGAVLSALEAMRQRASARGP